MREHILELEGVYQKYPDKEGKLRTVLNDIHLKISPGEFLTMVGPTGCGKSTLLRLILGSEKPFAGKVLMNGIEIQEPGPDRGVVFQQYSLYPNLTVLENVMLGLELKKFTFPRWIFRHPDCVRKSKRFKKRAHEYLSRVGLLKDADKYPHQLSGGMRQRAAIVQTMIMEPQILLMDEPLGALDVGTREEIQLFILDQWKRENQTIIFVTHDLEEAIYLGSRIIVLSQFYFGNRGEAADGSKIVKDVSIDWPLPRPTRVKHSKEFNLLMRDIRKEGLNPEYLQHIKDFDLRHQDAVQPLSIDNWNSKKKKTKAKTSS